MNDVSIAALFAVFIWWFSTGLVMLLDGLPRGTFRWSLVASTLLAVFAAIGLLRSAQETSVAASYCGFTTALLVWGWHELSFLTGWITGPRTEASPAGTAPRARFGHAVGAILWHELAIAAVGIGLVILTWDAPNQVGTWTFLVLWAMRTSAKLNLFLGVRNPGDELLPAHLAYLGSFFRRRRMNPLFPFCIAGAGAVLALIVLRVPAAAQPGEAVGLALVGTLLALAILEHLLLMLPIPTTALWQWALRHREAGPAAVAPLPLGGPRPALRPADDRPCPP